MEFTAQGFTKGAPGEVHQTDRAPAAPNGDRVSGGKFTDDLAVGTQDGCRFRVHNGDVNPGAERHDQRAVGQRMRTDWSDGEHLGGGEYDRAAGRERIRSRAGWRADDQSVASVPGEGLAIDADVQFDEAGGDPAADYDIIESGVVDGAAVGDSGGLYQRARFELEFAPPDPRQSFSQFSRRDRCQKAQAANVDSQYGRTGAGNLASDPEHSPVASKDEQQIHLAGKCGRIRKGLGPEVSEARCHCVAANLAAGAGDEPGGLPDGRGTGNLS